MSNAIDPESLQREMARLAAQLDILLEKAEPIVQDHHPTQLIARGHPSDHHAAGRSRQPAVEIGGEALWSLASNDLRERDMRAEFFPDDLCDGAPWNILIDLLASRIENRTISVTSACYAARVPPTTALRHISVLVQDGWVRRTEDDRDKRRVFLSLTEKSVQRLTDYYDRVRYWRLKPDTLDRQGR